MLKAFLTIMFTAALGVSLASAANAGAIGWQSYGGLTVSVKGQAVGIPGGVIEHQLYGSGYKIDRQRAYAIQGVSGPICLWRMDSTLKSGGTVYSRSTGAYHGTCTWGWGMRDRYNYSASRDGQACAQLYIDSRSRAEQCHYVFR